jgi:hypothetical protein
MNCMKCGAETKDDKCFCENCLAGMERYPVKPGTPVILPERRYISAKRPARKQRKPEEIIASQKRTIRRLSYVLVGAVIALCIVSGMFFTWAKKNNQSFAIGQNYSTSGTASSASTAPSGSTNSASGTP